MAVEQNELKQKFAKFETPFLLRQTESHLIFGPLSRHFATAYLMLGGAIIGLIAGFLTVNKPVLQYLGAIVDKLIFLIVPFIFLKLTLRQQAVLGWISVKSALGIAAIMMATIGSAVSFQRGQADAWPNLFLGLIWIPGLEFIPKITPYQRYLTLARIALSIPCIYFGVKSGNWHW